MKKWGYIDDAESRSAIQGVQRVIRALNRKGLVDVIILRGSSTGRGYRYKKRARL
ncbi:MAG: hypothetical protein ACYCT2_04515 [Thermoplasmataceae archaeon]